MERVTDDDVTWSAWAGPSFSYEVEHDQHGNITRMRDMSVRNGGDDLVHKPEHGKRAPILVGMWVIHYVPGDSWGAKPRLFEVLSGPRYEKNAQGNAIAELWKCDDGRERSRYEITPFDLVGLVMEARAAAACLLAGMRVDREAVDSLWVRSARAAELAQGHRYINQTAHNPRVLDLMELISASKALSDARDARYRFAASTLPIITRNLYVAGALAAAELAGATKLLTMLLLGKENQNATEG